MQKVGPTQPPGPSDNGSRKCKWSRWKFLVIGPIEFIFSYVVALGEESLSLKFRNPKVTPAQFTP